MQEAAPFSAPRQGLTLCPTLPSPHLSLLSQPLAPWPCLFPASSLLRIVRSTAGPRGQGASRPHAHRCTRAHTPTHTHAHTWWTQQRCTGPWLQAPGTHYTLSLELRAQPASETALWGLGPSAPAPLLLELSPLQALP